MAVKIKLQRIGKIRTPQYRIVVQDSRTRTPGNVIENLGIYQPANEPSVIDINSERAQYWVSVGAQPTETALALLKVTGDWQKAKGLEGESTLKPQVEKKSKLDIFNEALAEAADGPTAEAITEKKRKAKEEAEAKAAAEAEAAEKAEEEAKKAAEAEAAKAEEEEAKGDEEKSEESAE